MLPKKVNVILGMDHGKLTALSDIFSSFLNLGKASASLGLDTTLQEKTNRKEQQSDQRFKSV